MTVNKHYFNQKNAIRNNHKIINIKIKDDINSSDNIELFKNHHIKNLFYLCVTKKTNPKF